MLNTFSPPLEPRKHPVKILAPSRFSDGPKQTEASNRAQSQYCQEYLARNYDGQVDWHFFPRKGEGERLDFSEIDEINGLIESGEFDLIILEDLGRYLRRIHAYLLCELCEDVGTRLIAINDQVDTARGDWRTIAMFATMKHEMSNRDTSLRIKRSKREGFRRGMANRLPVYGYVVPRGTKNFSEWSKDPDAEAIYDEWFRRLEEGQLDEEVADWLNELKIEPGPYCRGKKWTGPMVGRISRNPILKGLPMHNERITKRKNKTGIYESKKAPVDHVIYFAAPHLAFIEPGRFDRVQRRRAARNAKYSRNKNGNGTDPLENRPRRRTPWPGQHACCAICRRIFVFGGHGRKEFLMCKGARAHACWNGITFAGPDAAKRMAVAILRAVEEWPDYSQALCSHIDEAIASFESSGEVERKRLMCLRDKKNRELDKFVQFVRDAATHSARLAVEIQTVEAELAAIDEQLYRLDQEKPNRISALPPMDEIRQLARDQISRLSCESWEFAKLMRRLLPRVVVQPYRLVDGTGHPALRAHFELTLFEIRQPAIVLPEAQDHLTRKFIVDLFEPPMRVAYRERVMALRHQTNPRLTNHQIAAQLNINPTDVVKCANLDRAMRAQETDDPYVPLAAPPDNYTKLSRHKHSRYQFEPLDDFEI